MITTQQLREVLDGIEETPPRVWQSRSNPLDKWQTYPSATLTDLLCQAGTNREIRLLPIPKLRVIRAEELPPVFYFRTDPSEEWHLVSIFGKGYFRCHGYTVHYYFSNAQSFWQYSVTRKPEDIHSFMVPDEGEGT